MSFEEFMCALEGLAIENGVSVLLRRAPLGCGWFIGIYYNGKIHNSFYKFIIGKEHPYSYKDILVGVKQEIDMWKEQNND